MMTASNIHYEMADRTRATAAGGMAAFHLLVQKLGLDQAIDRHLLLFKMHLLCHESDHVLNIAYNLLAGGTCLEHLEYVRFIFGIDAMPNLYEIVEELPKTAWKELKRPAKYEVKTEPQRRPENVTKKIVNEREFKNIRLMKECAAEFTYQPAKGRKAYRVVVVWKDLEVSQGQKNLFDDDRCFFYITNDRATPSEGVVFSANDQ